MYHFCTYFDQHYLPRGLALIHSLQQHCAPFHLWVLCLDDICHATLAQLALPELTLITLGELERALPELPAARQNRSLVEYYFTCTPALTWHVLEQNPALDMLMYLDADMFFFSDPAAVVAAMARHAITVIPHRYPEYLAGMNAYGVYNVGLLAFRRDATGLACLRQWYEQCVEWCYDRLEGDRYADQKYLERWPEQFGDVLVLEHKGVNTAPWYLMNYRFSLRGGQVFVDDDPLVLFHFHGFKQPRLWLYDTHTARYATRPPRIARTHVYRGYIAALALARASAQIAAGVRYAQAQPRERAFLARMRKRLHYVLGILQGRYLIDFRALLRSGVLHQLLHPAHSPLVYIEWLNGLAPLAYHGGFW